VSQSLAEVRTRYVICNTKVHTPIAKLKNEHEDSSYLKNKKNYEYIL
jgi:hypothetical protein